MKLSEQTLTVLKNFTSINPSIVFKPGFEIKTISPQKTVMASATIPDEIPANACIYDMSRFLSILSLYKEPEIEFEERNFIIKEGRRRTKYVYADVSMVIVPPEKEIKLPSEDVKVDVKWDDLQSVLKAAGVLQFSQIAFVGEDGKCFLKAIDNEQKGSDDYGVEIGDTEDTFQIVIKTENLKLLPQDYSVTISQKGISEFAGKDAVYFVAVDSKSTYTKG
jgi:hypothetical protein